MKPEPVAVADETTLREALRAVRDPEIGESIVELGLVERIEVTPGHVHATLIATSATCPMADLLVEDTERALRAACAPGTEVTVTIDWDTAWDPQRLSPALKARFGW